MIYERECSFEAKKEMSWPGPIRKATENCEKTTHTNVNAHLEQSEK